MQSKKYLLAITNKKQQQKTITPACTCGATESGKVCVGVFLKSIPRVTPFNAGELKV